MATNSTQLVPAGFNWTGKDKTFVVEGVLDLTGSAVTENDDYQLITIPANTLIISSVVEVVTAAVGTTCTIDVGYGGNGVGTVDDLGSNIDGKVVAFTHTVATAGYPGLYVAAADTIDVNFDVATSITAGPKLVVRLLCVDFS